jgi:hypothetical protein
VALSCGRTLVRNIRKLCASYEVSIDQRGSSRTWGAFLLSNRDDLTCRISNLVLSSSSSVFTLDFLWLDVSVSIRPSSGQC